MKLNLKYWLLATATSIVSIVITWFLLNEVYMNLIEKDLKDLLLQETRTLSIVYSKILSRGDDFEDILETISNIENGYYYVIDSNGKVLLHTDKTKIGRNLKNEGLGNLLNEIFKKSSGSYTYIYNSQKIFSTFSKFTANSENYYLIRAVKYSEVFSIDPKNRVLILIILFSVSAALSLIIKFFMNYMMKPLVEQTMNIKNFIANTSTSVLENSSAAVEVKNTTENTKKSYDNLDTVIQDFASSIEEARAETEKIFENLRTFMENTSIMTEKSMQIASFTDSLNELNDRITELSDTITVLAINATVETSREKIDREGLNKISELITSVSADSRKMAKESRKMLDEIKNVISESVLIAEKIEKDTKATEDSLEMIREVLDNFVDNVDKLTKLSYNFRHSMEEVLLGVEQLLDSIEDISKSISELNQKFEKLDF